MELKQLLFVRHTDGSEQDVMKNPTEGGKSSLPGPLAVKRLDGIPTVFPHSAGIVSKAEDLLHTVYDHGPVEVGSFQRGNLPKETVFQL